MTTSHRTDGPGRLALPGPGDFAAIPANENDPFGVSPPITGVRGLVLAFETREDDSPLVTIRAMDESGSLAPALHTAYEPDDIIALWRGLGRDLDLPLFILDIRGIMTPVTSIRPNSAFPRRKGSPLSGRRPRFLMRRKVPLSPFAAKPEKSARTER